METIAAKGHTILVIGPFIWGTGKTLDAAKKQARRFGKIEKGNYEAWQVPEGTQVDDMGRFSTHRDCPDCKQLVSIKK